VLAYAEAKMLAFADRRGPDALAVVDEQRHRRVAEPERPDARELFAEAERQLRPSHDRIDVGERTQVVVGQHRIRVGSERSGEDLDLLGANREARSGAMAAEALQMRCTRAQPAVQVERGDGPARSFPLLVAAGEQNDPAVVAL